MPTTSRTMPTSTTAPDSAGHRGAGLGVRRAVVGDRCRPATGRARRRARHGAGHGDQLRAVPRHPGPQLRAGHQRLPDPLETVLGPVGVRHITALVQAIDTAAPQVTATTADGPATFAYDRLVIALGQPTESAPCGPAGPAANPRGRDRHRGRRGTDRYRGGLRDSGQTRRGVCRPRRRAAGAADRPQRRGRLRHG